MSMSSTLSAMARLIRFDKPVGTLLLFMPTSWALLVAANGLPPLWIILVFAAGVFCMRSAGCAINDIADRDIDGFVARTKTRPLATGALSVFQALLVVAFFLSCSLLLVLTLNHFTLLLAFPGIALAAIYPFMKRYTHWPQVVLGAAFNWGIMMAFAAIQQQLPPVAWLMFAVGLLWTVTYDTMYAMADREDDLKLGVKSTAILFGDLDVAILSSLHVIVALGLLLLGLQLQLAWPYFLGVAVAVGFACYQIHLIWHREPGKCFQAFLNNVYYGGAVLVGLLLALL